tara:strand:+ start:5605 stop:6597 length:993 start_codon:yes stop_codon:yes gene_type:complete
MTSIVNKLTPVTSTQKENVRIAPKTERYHKSLISQIESMDQIEIGEICTSEPKKSKLRVAAWNLERCYFVDDTANYLRKINPDIILLSEIDYGMSRTAQKHTARELSQSLGMEYAYAVEFFEIGLGTELEIKEYCKDRVNNFGWHGNAILSRLPMTKHKLIRLDDHGHWFCLNQNVDPNQPRVGGRLALAVEINGACFVSTHLESAADSKHRFEQMKILFNAIDQNFPSLPTLIGGDLNTGNNLPPTYGWQNESLFGLSTERGYDWSFNANGYTTRPSLITPNPTRKMKLDWFLARNLSISESVIEASLSETGLPLSDHDCIWCDVSFEA